MDMNSRYTCTAEHEMFFFIFLKQRNFIKCWGYGCKVTTQMIIRQLDRSENGFLYQAIFESNEMWKAVLPRNRISVGAIKELELQST